MGIKGALVTMLLLIMICIAQSGCTKPRIVQLSADTYMVTKGDSAGMFSDIAKLKAEVIDEANKFAAERGKVAVAIDADVRKPGIGFPSYEYQFKLVDPDDPAARGASIPPSKSN